MGIQSCQLVVVAALLSNIWGQPVQSHDDSLVQDTVQTLSENPTATPFAGVDAFETRLVVAFVLIFLLAILAVLLSLKIERLDKLRGID